MKRNPSKRMAKKIAKKYINSPKGSYLPYGVVKSSWHPYNDGTPAIVQTHAWFPWKVKKRIWKLANERGWDNCHWGDPTLLETDDKEMREYEERFNPPHCW